MVGIVFIIYGVILLLGALDIALVLRDVKAHTKELERLDADRKGRV